MHNSWWVFLLGIFFFVCGILYLRRQVTLQKNGVHTTGVIVDVEQGLTDEGGKIFRPIVQFTTHDGQQIVWKYSGNGTFWKNARGKQMQIIYDPRNPQEVIRNHWSSFILPAVFVSVSVLLWIIPFLSHQ